jgi:hypothetical protein
VTVVGNGSSNRGSIEKKKTEGPLKFPSYIGKKGERKFRKKNRRSEF